MAELKSCPFCGGEVELKDLTSNLYGFNGYEIKCSCGCSLKSHLCSEPRCEGKRYFTPVTERGKSKALKDLLVLWNTRTPKEENPKVTCANCKHLMFSDFYGECNKRLKIVNPSDTCEFAEPKERGEQSETYIII